MNPLLSLLGQPWIERLGSTLLHFLWEGILIALSAQAVFLALRRRSAPGRYLVGCAALALLGLAPIITLEGNAEPQPAGPAAAPAGEQLEVSLDHASLEIVSTDGTNFAVETFQMLNGKLVRDPAEPDCQLTRDHGALHLDFPSDGRTGVWQRLFVPKSTALKLKTSHGNITVPTHSGSLSASTSVGHIRVGRVQGEVDLQTSAGDVWLEQARSAVQVRTSGGKMVLGDIGGRARLDASGGSISVRRADGELQAKTSGGSVNVGDARSRVQAQANGGSVLVSFTGPLTGASALKASGGNVQVGLRPELNARIAAKADGEVNTSLPIEWKDEREGYRRGLLNELGGTLTLRAEGGNISIRSFDEPATPTEELLPVQSRVPTGEARPVRLAVPAGEGVLPNATATREVPAPEPLRPIRDAAIWAGADWKPVKMLLPGLLLRTGIGVEAEVSSVDDRQVTYQRPGHAAESIKASEVAAVLFVRMPDTRRKILEGGRSGVMLRNGDFVEGECKKLNSDRVTLSSVLLGLSTFALRTEAVALVLGGP